MRGRLSDETIDGMILENALALSPVLKARREAYWAGVRDGRARLRGVADETVLGAVRAMRLWTVEAAFGRPDAAAEAREAVAFCLQGRDGPEWEEALGLAAG